MTVGWGCTNAPPECLVRATTLQASGSDRAPGRVLREECVLATALHPGTNVCTKGVRLRSTVNRGDSGGPLLVRDPRGNLRQVGVTALGADSKTKLYAGFTSVPVERRWIAEAIRSVRNG